jgi:hypothetical protein|uniref:Uncharacterized protein n=1 Tax=Oryza sativa subsp. japonica TaxID=39947 RepID=Q8GVZ5_ORYSJ|nr:hypothetical protein [Oryza sativa Japonica Group]BAC83500.1 hypothetical protein [Oryza sativa Japonica Group]
MRPSHHDASQSASAGPAGRREAGPGAGRPLAAPSCQLKRMHAIAMAFSVFVVVVIYSLFLSTCRRRRALAYLAADS